MGVPTTIFWCLALVGFSQATTSLSLDLSLIQSSTPECALNCSAPSISGLTCLPTSVQELADCVCPNFDARKKISACFLQSCNSSEALQASMPSRSYCAPYPIQSRSGETKIAAIVLLAVTIPFVVGRAWSRMAIMNALWWDDYTLALAAVILVANLIIIIPLSNKGLGKHRWDIDPLNAAPINKMFYSAQVSYTLVQFITKISILLCFLRIFPQRWFRRTIYGTLAFITLKGAIILLMLIFRCLPFSSISNPSITPKCLKLYAIVYAAAAFSIFEDVWILVLPIPVLQSLNIKRAKKLVLVGMFSVGSLACITSMIRLKHIQKFGVSFDPTYDNVDISIWSLIENSVAVICACLPALRPLMSRLLPRVFGTLSGRTAYGTQDSASKRTTAGDRRLVDDFEPAGQRTSTRGSVIGSTKGLTRVSTRGSAVYGKRDVELVTESGSSFNFGGEEEREGIRLNTVVSVEVEHVQMPEKGHVKGSSFDFDV